MKIFKRLSFHQRGHFSNYFTLRPVKEIRISEDALLLKVGAKTHSYKWHEIKSATLLLFVGQKYYGKYASGEIVIRRFILETPDRTFICDLSKQFPDFGKPDELLEELRRHLDVEEERYEQGWRRYWWSVLLFLPVFVGIKVGIFSATIAAIFMLILLIIDISSFDAIRHRRKR